jgi:PKD repeat protein
MLNIGKMIGFEKKIPLLLVFLFSCSLAFTQVAFDKNVIFIIGQVTDEQTGAPIDGQVINIEADHSYSPDFNYSATLVTDKEGFYYDTIPTFFSKGALRISTLDYLSKAHDTTVYFRFIWSEQNYLFPDIIIPIQNSIVIPQATFKIVYDPSGESPMEIQFYNTTNCQNLVSTQWNFGDGHFSTIESPLHEYAEPGVYRVQMTVTVPAGPFSNLIESTITKIINVTYKEYFSFGGQIFAGYFPIDYAAAYLYKVEETKIIPIDTAIYNDTLGYYLFPQLIEGKYFVKADMLPASTLYNAFLTTYFSNSIMWEAADTIFHYSTYWQYDINMAPASTMTFGPGGIEGVISFGNGKGPACNVEILLLDNENNPLGVTHSDENGNFAFDDIAFGTYKVHAEVTGKNTLPVNLTLNGNNPSFEDVQLFIQDNFVSGNINAISENEFIEGVSDIFPNPVVDKIQFSVNFSETTDLVLTLFNSNGQLVNVYNINSYPGENNIELDITNLTSGIYLLKITDKSNQVVRRFLKR